MMSSSDGRRVAGKAVAAEPGIRTTAATEARRRAGDSSEAASAEVGELAPANYESGSPERGGSRAANGEADGFESADPWFGVAPRPAAFDPEATQVDWFMPGGRAGLLPDSMTVSADESEHGRRQQLAPAEAAGAPPWAAERAA